MESKWKKLVEVHRRLARYKNSRLVYRNGFVLTVSDVVGYGLLRDRENTYRETTGRMKADEELSSRLLAGLLEWFATRLSTSTNRVVFSNLLCR